MESFVKSFLAVLLVLVAAAVNAADLSVVERYNKTCAICHANGAGGAPKPGSEEWQPRLKKGMDELMLSVKNGFKGMPPKGMCFDCTDKEFKQLIEYLTVGNK